MYSAQSAILTYWQLLDMCYQFAVITHRRRIPIQKKLPTKGSETVQLARLSNAKWSRTIMAPSNEEETTLSLPQKRYYRQRAHSNPIADHCFDYPAHPSDVDWSILYPKYNEDSSQRVEFADIGCGYGGFLVTLGEMFPDRLAIGMEIRVKVSDYVMDRIKALRSQHPGKYNNIACIRTNAMKYLPNYFVKHQLDKMFFLYPDPHFKRAKHKWRIINQALLSEYAYVLRKGGLVYTMTDVEDLHNWIVKHMEDHPLFERISAEEEANDPITPKLYQSSEEGAKVVRNKGSHFLAIFRRI